ncbi:phloem protein 2-like protein [Tanacetum coccineum]
MPSRLTSTERRQFSKKVTWFGPHESLATFHVKDRSSIMAKWRVSHVYSFGVVLFEVLSGRLAYFPRSKDDQEYLPQQTKRCFEENNVKEIIDPKLMKEFEKCSTTTADENFPDSISIFAKIAYKCLQKRADRPTMTHVLEELQKSLKSHVTGVEALRTSLEAIIHATNDFSDVMEQDEHGKVYRGRLCHSKGHKLVIVKRLDRKVGTYGNEFYKEIAMLYSYNHNNVIPILGFCEEDSERIVVFEHMVNGILKDHVKNPSLTWKQRLKICVDAARGLAYIHNIADIEHSVHGDIKSSCILLNHDWKAFISNFIISKGLGSTLGYCDPAYEITGILTQKSDVYSLGVVLLETLSGRLAIETLHENQQHPLDGGEDGQVIFLSKLASHYFKNKRPEEVIFHAIKGQFDAKSLVIFSTIANQCLHELPEDRPTMGTVVKELEKAYECQDEWEWEQKLPKDYKKILDMSTSPVSNTSPKKDLYSLISSGILLIDRKLWFSINADGVKNKMISARKFSYKNVKWRSIRKSRFCQIYILALPRFSKVAKISDISNLMIQVELKPQLLTPGIMYGAYLVFKFCSRRKISSLPLYVNLRYKKDGETLNAYFAEWRAGSEWKRVVDG